MIKRLLILSLIAIPFYEVILYFCIPGRTFPTFPDMRITKDFVMMVSCLTIGSLILCKDGFKKVNNFWILAFLVACFFSLFKAPNATLMLHTVNFDGMWNFKPIVKLFCLLYLFIGISSLNLNNKNIKNIFKTIAYCGLAMSIYMILQRFNIDQIFRTYSTKIAGAATNRSMGGTIGQPTLSTPFIVMCLPFMVYLRRWFFSLIMCGAVVLSESAFAIAGLFSIVASYFIFRDNKKSSCILYSFLFLIISILTFMFIHKYKPDLLVSNGRFEVWKDTFKKIIEGKIAFTGAGIGSYKYLYALKNGNTWYHAHNEYLQLLWSCGLIGIFCSFMAIKRFFKDAISIFSIESFPIILAFIGIGVISIGNFPLQLAVYQYYLVVMAGIIYSLKGSLENG